MIPLVDLKAQYRTIKGEILGKIEEVIESSAFIQGEYVSEFESKFSKMFHSRFCMGCSNGTAAIFLALAALGIKEGDEVITVSFTFIGTAEGICHTGAKPVFVDIDPDTYNIDASKIEAAVNEKTRAIIPVHLYGNPADMNAILKIAEKYHLKVVEDCAQAHLAKFKGKIAGTFGDIGTFSFFPGKNLGAYGDAGALITDSKELEERIRKLLDHGRSRKYYHEMVGYNHRLDGLQAAVLSVKMNHIEEWTKKRRENARIYTELLSKNKSIILPKTQQNGEHVYHLYVIRVNNRDEALEYLKSKGIAASIHYPVPLHLQPAFKYLGYEKGDFPVSESVSEKILSLPMYPELTGEQIEFICSEVNKAVH